MIIRNKKNSQVKQLILCSASIVPILAYILIGYEIVSMTRYNGVTHIDSNGSSYSFMTRDGEIKHVFPNSFIPLKEFYMHYRFKCIDVFEVSIKPSWLVKYDYREDHRDISWMKNYPGESKCEKRREINNEKDS